MKTLPVLGEAHETPGVAAFRATAAPHRFEGGFSWEETEDGLPFRWMSTAGCVAFDPNACERYLEVWVRSHFYDLSQSLAAEAAGAAPETHLLARGWNALSLLVPSGAGSVRLDVNKSFPREYYPGDGRDLAVQVRSVLLHADPARHAHIRRQQFNRIDNLRETLEGRTLLKTSPPKLGIDIQGACNVKPPCVYCAWDFNKALEGSDVAVPFTRETLAEWGEVFENSAELVNCSIGEPFMGRNLDELLEAFGERGKLLEMTTNGQILTEGNIRRLLGHHVHLYVSLDAATPSTYARLRNNRFDQVVANVRRLIEAKGGRGRLPLVFLVFMPIRANLHEVDAFVQLCAALNVDRLVLRPLNDSEGVELKWDREGYHFDYQQELLPWLELVKVSGRVSELCRRLGVPLADQLDFGGSMERQFAEAFAEGRSEAAASLSPSDATRDTPPQPVSLEVAPAVVAEPAPPVTPAPRPLPSLGEERLPACTEPWSSLYILRRGVLPCCYGGTPIAKMGEYREAWNAPLTQAIRRELAQGRFHTYCFDSPDCPIVKKSHEAHVLSTRQEAWLRARRVLDRWKRQGWGWPGRVYRQGKAYWMTGARRLRRLFGMPPG